MRDAHRNGSWTAGAGAGSIRRMHQQQAQEAVAVRPVRFDSEGAELVGELFVPPGADRAGPLPGVVVGGTWTSVRQQMTQRYARKLAAEGLVALSFDFRTYGESEGELRDIESPAAKAVDLANAAAFLATRPEVEGSAMGGMAICASAGYMAHAIAGGAPLKAFATSAAWLHDPSTVGLMYGGEDGVSERRERAAAARERFDRDGEVEYVPAESPDDPAAAMVGVPFYESPERGRVPEWGNRFAVMQWEEWLTYDALAPAARITVPTALVHSDGAALPDNVRRFHAALAGPKTLVWMEGEHTAFYDTEPTVTAAARAAAGHLRTALEAV